MSIIGIRCGQGADSYPTREEILDGDPKHKASVIKMVKQWKKETWWEARKGAQPIKFQALSDIISNIASEIYKKPVDVEYNPETYSCAYSPARNVIIINSSLSVISALHELAHHLFGASEKKACIWSVHLFRKTFPTAYSRLEWDGHMMVKAAVSSQ